MAPSLRPSSVCTLIAQLQTSEGGIPEQIKPIFAVPQRPSQDALGNYSNQITETAQTSALPSTVPESANLHDALQSLPPDALKQIVQRMSSQNEATQELSPSVLDDIVSRRFSVIRRDEETQHTLHEGETGHIDLTSSFVQDAHEDISEPEEDGQVAVSQPAEFSPTQTQNRLPSFPESQRFKTPATAGRKRDCNGNTKETPDLPRPNFRAGAPTRAPVMGLSQAFAATQAATSPLLDGIANPLSDRPSPNVDLEVRPATATTSSPMRPISDFKRATTEPMSAYRSMQQSQAERNRRALLNLPPEEDSDDDFSQETSIITKQIRQRQRDAKIRDQLTMSSPTKDRARENPVTKSSPVKPAQRSSPSPGPDVRRASQLSPREEALRSEDVEESEAETEQEDEDDQPESNTSVIIDEEDKENDERIVQIPQTTVRLHKIMNDVPSEVEQSPSLRARLPHHEGSNPVAVANSQPSQPFSRSQRQQPKSSANSGIDFVPQSQAGPPADSSQGKEPETRPESRDSEAQDLNKQFHSELQQSSAPAQLVGTIPETSSSKQVGQSAPAGPKTTEASRSVSDSNFETAPTRMPARSSARSKLLEMSSPPIVTTPPGRKRKRMTDISAEPSPQKSTQRTSQDFNAEEALLDSDMVGLTSQSPIKARSKRRRIQPTPVNIEKLIDTRQQPKPKSPADVEQQEIPSREPSTDLIRTPPRAATTQRLGLRRAKPVTSTEHRTSVWDVEDSPIKPKPPSSKAPSPRRNSRNSAHAPSEAKRSAEQEKPPSTATEVPKDVPEPGRAGRRPGRPKKITPMPSQKDGQVAQETGSTILAQPQDPPVDLSTTQEPTPSEFGRPTPVDEVTAPDMVFACFNGKSRAYYPARLLERFDGDPPRYKIQWEGYDPDEIDAYGVKAIDLRVGDQVKIDLKGFAKVPYVVRNFKNKVANSALATTVTDIRGFGTIVVAPKQRKSLPADISTDHVLTAPISAIYLDNNMWNQMKSRTFESRVQVSQATTTSGYATPNEMPSTPPTPSTRAKRQSMMAPPASTPPQEGLFANMIFAISYEESTRKHAISDLIPQNGGTVVRESFIELLQADTIEPKAHLSRAGFTALLADKLSRKEKYMQALALGLPCLSGKWIEACVQAQHIVDWQIYLLPAGESAALDGAIRSRIMPTIDPLSARLCDMLNARPQPLTGLHIAAIVGRGKQEAKRKAYLFLLQALGASTVEKFADIKAAKAAVDTDHFDWLFVEDRDVSVASQELAGKGRRKTTGSECKVAGNEVIVQSLILGNFYEAE